MIPVTQTKVVVRNSNDEVVVNGNCYAAAIASIMELSISEVPNVEVFFPFTDTYWAEVMHTWLSLKGWELYTDDDFRCFHTVFNDENYTRLDQLQLALKDKYYLVSGDSPRGVKHICIYQNGKLVHDPHPTRDGILTFEIFETLEPKQSK